MIERRRFPLSIQVGRAVLTGVAFAALWIPPSLIIGSIIVGETEPEHIGGALYTGLFAGAVFSALSGHASGKHRLAEIGLAPAAGWGALAGFITGTLPFILGEQNGSLGWPLWVLPTIVITSLTFISAVTAPLCVLGGRSAAVKNARA